MALLRILILVFTLSLSRNEEEQPTNILPSCKLFRLLIIWQTSCGEDASFVQQRRLLIDLIKNVPDGTEIVLTTVGTSLENLINIKKDSKDESWVNIIVSRKPENLRKHIIPHSLISKAVYSFLNQVGHLKRGAEEIFFVANKKSVIDDIETLKERLTYKILFVIFAGTSSPPEVWTNLATDRHHLFVLSGIHEENVKPVTKEILILCCQDSRLICDTDEYWTGKRCYKCSHICSYGTTYPSEICLKECPYFASDQCAKVVKDQSVTSDQTVPVAVLLLLCICAVLIAAFAVFIVLYFFCMCWKKKRLCNSNGNLRTLDQIQTEQQGHNFTSLSDPGNMSFNTVRYSSGRSEVDNTHSGSDIEDDTKPLLISESSTSPNTIYDKSDMEIKFACT